MAIEPCGMCSGRGWYFGNCYDRLGYKRHDEPPRIRCEYCDGSGACEDGNKLLPAIEPDNKEPRENEGNPSWA